MMTPTRIFTLAFASLLAVAAAGAQDSLNLRGSVKSVAGNPIEGVEVRIEGFSKTTRTTRDGTFAFYNAPKGPQVLMFRLLGYLPATAEARVPTKNEPTEPVEVTMLPTPHSLDTVKVTGSVNVLAGVVVDHKDKPIAGATVEMLGGKNISVTTDSSGWFTFTAVNSGTVLVRARKLGFSPQTTSIRLEDWRGLVFHMEPLDYTMSASKLETASGFGNTNEFVWNETQSRLTQRGGRSVIIPREELALYDDYPLGEAIPRTHSGAILAADFTTLGNSMCVLVNGKTAVGTTSLNSFNTEAVEFVEAYPPGTESSGTVGRYLRAAGCRRVQTTSSFKSGAYYIVVWMR